MSVANMDGIRQLITWENERSYAKIVTQAINILLNSQSPYASQQDKDNIYLSECDISKGVFVIDVPSKDDPDRYHKVSIQVDIDAIGNK